jgi:hypothetical protein
MYQVINPAKCGLGHHSRCRMFFSNMQLFTESAAYVTLAEYAADASGR